MEESQEQGRFLSGDQMNLGPEVAFWLLSQMAESLSFRRGRLSWREVSNGIQRRSAFTMGVEGKAESSWEKKGHRERTGNQKTLWSTMMVKGREASRTI